MLTSKKVSVLAIFKDRILVGDSQDSFITDKPKFSVNEGDLVFAHRKYDEFKKLISSFLTLEQIDLKGEQHG